MAKKKYKWSDITLGQFEMVSKLYYEFEEYKTELDKERKKLKLTELNEEQLLKLQLAESKLIRDITLAIGVDEKNFNRVDISFLNETFDDVTPDNKVDIDGISYSIQDYQHIKFKEYTDMMMLLKSTPYNYSFILAILCRKNGELYDEEFEVNKLMDRSKIFKTVRVDKLFPLINFIKALLTQQEIKTHFYSVIKEMANLNQDSLSTFPKNGVGKALFILLHPMIYQKLKLLDNIISLMSCNSSLIKKRKE
jgi:hypothetical protein